MKYLKHYWLQVWHWWSLPKKIDWVDDFWAPLGSVLAVCLVLILWVFMIVLGPIWEVISWPWQMKKLQATKQESMNEIKGESDLNQVVRYRKTLEERYEAATEHNRKFEAENLQEVIDVAKRREVELHLGMKEHGTEEA